MRCCSISLIPFLAATETAVAGAVLLVAEIDRKNQIVTEIFGQLGLLGCCVIGSAAGAFMAIGIGRNITSTRQICLQFGTSQLAGMCFTPMLMRYSGLPLSADFVLGCSAAVAISAVTGLQQLSHLWLTVLAKKLGLDVNKIDVTQDEAK